MDVFHSRSLEHFLEVPPLLLSAHFSKELSMMSAEEVYIGSKLKSSEKIPTLFVYARPQGKSLTTVYIVDPYSWPTELVNAWKKEMILELLVLLFSC